MLSLMTELPPVIQCFCTSTSKKGFPVGGISVLTYLKPILTTESVTKIAVTVVGFLNIIVDPFHRKFGVPLVWIISQVFNVYLDMT